MWQVRPMTREDVKRVAEIERLSFSIPWSEQAFFNELENNERALYLVVEGPPGVVGFVGMWCIVDEGHITNIAIHPDWRGRGLGKKLMEALLIEAERRGLVAVTLEVRPSNTAGQRLYRSLGFTVAGRRRGYYQDNGEDALLMWLYLDQAEGKGE
ncbi:MAG: ribosomal protein S18-alanine N-acetyltransferase [Bacillota bacterium]|uniref:[Ribosomal protein bS18]-alanine N-acetyltransferase n=2 Tax=Carboxydocella TaxID=178898 RepID=A0A1T4RY44_9FIRM|nr:MULTISPECIES: ribosomal protein S18-alanine N-acetyltransferase [Carboxydocella]AVX21400.1 ribosomal-protein-alanine N-acetyltransferase [Carboxydocella thermautotrophica]AVX31889.1 ribosomal-protein-alanine N-acetyltransferase [Carboxydocella thermautotrophica]SKA20919.1 [SSU ribosomal protein S18P]-alanine acetyltransferase [Carboxydocella sporoproducens DSM 16521]